jgi:hypothetical protein
MHRRRVLCFCMGLAILAAPGTRVAHAQIQPGSDHMNDESTVTTLLLQPSLFTGAMMDARLLHSQQPWSEEGAGLSSQRWPENPALGAFLGGAIGCAAGYVLFFVFGSGSEDRVNRAAWSCFIAGVIGYGAGSGWQLPSEAQSVTSCMKRTDSRACSRQWVR